MWTYLFEGLQQIASRNRQGDVYVVHDEQRLLLALEWETGKVVRYKQQHVHISLLQEKEEKAKFRINGTNSQCNDHLLFIYHIK